MTQPGVEPDAVADPPAGGEASQFHVSIDRLQLAGGTSIDLPPAGVTAVVGPNNPGKSLLLRQVWSALGGQVAIVEWEPQLVQQLTLRRSSESRHFVAWLKQHASWSQVPAPFGQGFVPIGVPRNHPLTPQAAAQQWDHGNPHSLGELAPFLVQRPEVDARTQMIAGQVGRRSTATEPPTHPLHLLEVNTSLRQRLSDLTQRQFGLPLTFDSLGALSMLRVGLPGVPAPPVNEVDEAYWSALAKLPSLNSQGDGLKSFLGVLVPMLVRAWPIVIVDEPEAYLHPPQAYVLGQQIALAARDRGIQVLLATHDRSLLAGLLDVDEPVTIVRLTRSGDSTTVHQLPAGQVQTLWTDPVMRYSNMLEGLFARLVVLAEDDRDCRFYSAALDADQDSLPIPTSEVHLVPTNGKAAIAGLVHALRRLGVAVVATADLDMLRDTRELQHLVAAFGGDWPSLETDWRTATQQFTYQPTRATVGEIRRDVLSALSQEDEQVEASSITRAHVLTALRGLESPWGTLKRSGLDAINRGEPTAAAERLLGKLDELGIVLVRVGELEGFAPDLPVAKGPRWLGAALHQGYHRQPGAQSHVRRLMHRFV